MTDLHYVEGHAGERVVMVNAAGADQGADAPLQARSRAASRAATADAGARPDRARTAAGQAALRAPSAPSIWIAAISSGRSPHGETPDYIRNSPALKGITVPRTGQTGFNIGTLVTKNLVIAGDATVTTTPDHPRGAMLRAYDQKTGKEVGNVLMPAGQSGSPMTYMVNGRQYIIVAVSGGNYSGEYISYTLPRN